MSVFNRLTDESSYTGMYAERMKPQKGGDGIENPAHLSNKTSGPVPNVPTLLRPNLGIDSRLGSAPAGSNANMSRTSSKGSVVRRGKAANMRRKSIELLQNAAASLTPGARLKILFRYYCTYGRSASGGMGSAQNTIANNNFAKFARECPGLLDRHLTKTNIDLIFVKAKSKSGRRLNFSQFIDALHAMSVTKFPRADPEAAFEHLLNEYILTNPNLQASILTSSVGMLPVNTPPQRAPALPVASTTVNIVPSPTKLPQHAKRSSSSGDEIEEYSIYTTPEEEAYSTLSHGHYYEHSAGIAPPVPRYKAELRRSTHDTAAYVPPKQKKGSIFDRLSDVDNFSGIYKRRFTSGDGRINGHASTYSLKTHDGTFKGNTNTNTDVIIYDISSEMRPNLRGSTRMKL